MKIDPEVFAARLIAVATDFVGLGETENNKTWDDPRTAGNDADKTIWLRTWMAKVDGWTPGEPYCAAFVGAVVASQLYGSGVPMVDIQKKWLSVWSAHCMTNIERLKKRGILSSEPVKGALWLLRSGTSQSGHAGMVAATNGRQISTIEGNTNAVGGREGDGIFLKMSPISGRGSLKTQGFLHPSAILNLMGVA